MRARSRFLSATCIFLFSLAANAAQVPAGVTLADKQILRKSNGAEVQTLDPHKAEGVPSSNILRDLYEGLTSEAVNGDVIPGAATSWDISKDGREYIFHLRRNAKWSNGDAVTAQDFVAGIRRTVDPATGSKYAQIVAPILNAEAITRGDKPPSELGVQAIDDYTLKLILKEPTPYILGLLNHSSTYPIHRPSLKQYGDKFSRPGQLVSNGAYQLKEWVVQSQIVLERNPYYWDNAHTVIDTVYNYPIEQYTTALKRYRADEIDWTYSLPNSQFTWIKQHLGDELHIWPYAGNYYYGFNLRQAPFKGNLKLRQALSMAIDREIITDKVTRFGELPAYGWVPPGITQYQSCELPYAHLSREARHAQARKLYEEAGYSASNPLRVEIRYNTEENHKKIAVAVASMWKKTLGVRTSLINEEWKVFLENRKQKRITQVFRAGWIGDYNDASTFTDLLHSNHGLNDSDYKNPKYDALLAAAAGETDLKKRSEILHQAECMALADHPVMPIYYYVTKRVLKPYVGGYQDNIMDHHYSKNFYIIKH